MNSELLEDFVDEAPSGTEAWLAWAFKVDVGGREIRLAGVFTDEAAADRCLDGLPTTHPGFRGGKEKVAMNAVFTLTEGYQAMLLGEMQ